MTYILPVNNLKESIWESKRKYSIKVILKIPELLKTRYADHYVYFSKLKIVKNAGKLHLIARIYYYACTTIKYYYCANVILFHEKKKNLLIKQPILVEMTHNNFKHIFLEGTESRLKIGFVTTIFTFRSIFTRNIGKICLKIHIVLGEILFCTPVTRAVRLSFE